MNSTALRRHNKAMGGDGLKGRVMLKETYPAMHDPSKIFFVESVNVPSLGRYYAVRMYSLNSGEVTQYDCPPDDLFTKGTAIKYARVHAMSYPEI